MSLARRLRVDLAGVLGTTGVILVVMGAAQLLPAAAALAQREGAALPLFLGALATALVGLLLLPLRSQSGKWTRRESLAIVAISWLAAIVAAAVPFVVSGTTGVVSGLFESASGLTTTGATVLPDVDGIPAPLHLWRALTHWMGGAGIVLVVLVITPWLGNAEELRRTQRSEASFLTERYRGSTRATLRALLAVYVGATAVHTALLVLLGVSPWDAVLHAFATISTGGFSSRTASLGAWGTAVQLVTVVFMLLGAISFVTLGRAITGGGVRAVLHNGEVRGYLVMIALVSLFMALVLVGWGDAGRYGAGPLGVWQALVDALVTVTAISTTTGFSTENYALWPAPCQVILLVLMLVGGCSGSTAGGIKFFRVQILIKHAYRELRTLANPGAVIPLRLGERVIEESEVRGALSYVTLYGALILALALVIAITGSDPVTAGAASVSSFGSIGPGFGDIDPAGSFQPLHPVAKLLCAFAMVLGRLEILPLLAACLPSFWLHRGRRGWRAPT